MPAAAEAADLLDEDVRDQLQAMDPALRSVDPERQERSYRV
jgi:hypothetical protein